jgi:hypothetical protein
MEVLLVLVLDAWMRRRWSIWDVRRGTGYIEAVAYNVEKERSRGKDVEEYWK